MSDVDPQKTVFISYRRNQTWSHARLVFNELRQRGYDVFMDVETLGSGEFEPIILQEIARRAHFLVLLTVPSLKRFEDPDDMFRREIEYAIDKQRNIVPILIEDFSFRKAKKYLKDKVAAISNYNGTTLRHENFDAAINRLVNQFLQQPVYGNVEPTPAEQKEEVERIVERAAALHEPTKEQLAAEILFIRAFTKADAGDIAGAVADYDEAIRLKPDFVEAYTNRGVARFEQGDYAGAIADYSEAVRLKPDYAEAYTNRGNARAEQGNYAGAIADFDEALRLKPDYAEACYNRGVARAEQGDFAGAISDYTEAIRLKPDYMEAYYNRGVARAEQGDYAGAIADYDEAIRLKPDFVEAYNNRGNARSEQGNYAGAIADYSEALRLKPDFAAAYYNRGNARAALSDDVGARADYEEARKLIARLE